MLSYAKLIGNARRFKTLTGMSLQKFDFLCAKAGKAHLRYDPQLRIWPSIPIILQMCAPKHATFV